MKIAAYENEAALSAAIEEKETALLQKRDILQVRSEDHLLLARQQNDILPYIWSEQAKSDIEALTRQVVFLQQEIGPKLLLERDAVRKHLEKQIASFFYTGLINQLYNKIDPHPEFKEVEFKANFDSDPPRGCKINGVTS